MGRLDEKTRYLGSNFLQNTLAFLVNIFFSFPKFIKIIYHGLFHSKQSFEFTPVYPSLQTESISSSCTSDFNQDLLPEIPDIKRQSSGPHDTIPEVMSFPQNYIASNIQKWYRPLYLPPILHDFPTKHYKYLPRFDGEFENFTAENFYKILSISFTSLK